MALASVGTIGTGTHSTSASSFTLTTATNALAAGDFALLAVVTDNIQTTTGASTDHTGVSGTNLSATKLGEYTNGQSAAGAGVTTSLWLLEATGAVGTGTVITMTLSGAVVDKTCSGWKFTKGAGMAVRLCTGTGFATNPIVDAINASNGFGSAAFSGAASAARLFFRALGKEANSTTALTVSSSFTAITAQRSRNNAAAVLVRGEFRINTSTGETSNPTMAVSGDTAAVFAALEEYDPKPAITAQPTNQSVVDGGDATFSYTDSGTVTGRQWQEQMPGEGGGAAYISFEQLTTGSNSLTIPSGAVSALVFLNWWHGGGSTPALACTALPDLTTNRVFTNGNSSPPYQAGRLRSRSEVTATGAQTLTISGQSDVFNGPVGFIVYLDGAITVVDEDMVSAGDTGDASLSLDTTTGALVFVVDNEMDTATPPGNPGGWTSLGTYSNNSMVSRLRMLTAPDAAGITTGSDGNYETLIGFSVEGGSGPTWEDVDGETTSTLELIGVALVDNGRVFRGSSTNSFGTTYTDAVTLTVTDGLLTFQNEVTGGVEVANASCTVPSLATTPSLKEFIIIGAGPVGGPAPNISTPTGWVKRAEETDLPLAGGVVPTTLCLFERTTGDPNTTVVFNTTDDLDAPLPALWGYTRFSYDDPNATVFGQATLGYLSSTDAPVLPGLTTTKTNAKLINWMSQGAAQGGDPPISMAIRVHDEAGGIVMADEEIADIGATGTRTWDMPAATDMVYAVIELHSLLSEEEGGTDDTAVGVTLTTTVSAIPGSASGERSQTAAGQTLGLTLAILAGTATGQVNDTADGALVGMTVSLIDGDATGEVNDVADGETLALTVSVTAGEATGQRQPTADGEVVGLTLTLIDGDASADQSGTADGDTLELTVSVVEGSAIGERNDTANGELYGLQLSLINGEASGERHPTADGELIGLTASLVPGDASGGGSETAPGKTFALTSSIVDGDATGERSESAAGQTITLLSSLTPGSADGTSGATAPGQTITLTVSLVDGDATGQRNQAATGQTLGLALSLIDGDATGETNDTANGEVFELEATLIPGGTSTGTNDEADGAVLALSASIVAGGASGQRQPTAAGALLTLVSSIVAGLAQGQQNATANGMLTALAASVLAGSATGGSDIVAPGASITVTTTVIPGDADGEQTSGAPGRLFTLMASVVPGSVDGQRNETADGELFEVIVSVIPGSARELSSAPSRYKVEVRPMKTEVEVRAVNYVMEVSPFGIYGDDPLPDNAPNVTVRG